MLKGVVRIIFNKKTQSAKKYDSNNKKDGSDLRVLSSELDESSHKLNTIIMAQIQMAITSWAQFERMVDCVVWGALQMDPRLGAKVTGQIQSVRSKLIIVEDISEACGASSSQIKEMRRFRNSIEGLTRERNRLIHDPTYVENGEIRAYREAANPGPQQTGIPQYEVINEDELNKFMYSCVIKSGEYLKLAEKVLSSVGRGPS